MLRSVEGWSNQVNGPREGTDDFGFEALPDGMYWESFSKSEAGFWSATGPTSGPWFRALKPAESSLKRTAAGATDYHSVRCLSDSSVSLATDGSKLKGKVVKGSFTDKRDGTTYPTISIGSKTWLAQNLRVRIDSSWCPEKAVSNCQIEGRLYPWKEAKRACPDHWHLPAAEEWDSLFNAVGGSYSAGIDLRSSQGWNRSGNGTDAVGFDAVAAGTRSTRGDFWGFGENASFWTGDEATGGKAASRTLTWNQIQFDSNLDNERKGQSVRCVLDSQIHSRD